MKQILFIMPFGEKPVLTDNGNKQPIMIDFDKKYDELKNTIDKLSLGFNVNRVDNIVGANIYKNMYKSINAADIVLADLTSLNPNVMYELGARHALRDRKTILFQQNEIINNDIPFDISIFKVLKASDLIKDFKSIIEKDELDSPIKGEIQEKYSSDKDVFDNYTNTWNDFDSEYDENLDLKERKLILEKYKISFEGIEEFDQKYAVNNYKLNDNLQGLQESLRIIQKHNPNTSINHETIGISCSISRKIFEITQNSKDEIASLDCSNHFISIYKTNYSFGLYGLNLMAKIEKEQKNSDNTEDMRIYYKQTVKMLLSNFSENNDSSMEPEYFLSTKYMIEALNGIKIDLLKIIGSPQLVKTSKEACNRAQEIWNNYLDKSGNDV